MFSHNDVTEKVKAQDKTIKFSDYDMNVCFIPLTLYLMVYKQYLSSTCSTFKKAFGFIPRYLKKIYLIS